MIPYCSNLEWMRLRAMAENKDLENFWHVWHVCCEKAFSDNKRSSSDYKQFKAENELFKSICEKELSYDIKDKEVNVIQGHKSSSLVRIRTVDIALSFATCRHELCSMA